MIHSSTLGFSPQPPVSVCGTGFDGLKLSGFSREHDYPHYRRRSEEHTSELQSLMRISYAVFCLKKKKTQNTTTQQYELQNTKENSITPYQKTHYNYRTQITH